DRANELGERKSSEEESYPFACYEHEDTDDEENRRHAADEDQQRHDLVDVPGGVASVVWAAGGARFRIRSHTSRPISVRTHSASSPRIVTIRSRISEARRLAISARRASSVSPAAESESLGRSHSSRTVA